jgi:hypothetical protein
MRILAQIGVAVWLQILMCGVALLFAGRFAWRARPGRLRVVGALAVATTFATVASICMGLAMAGRSAAQMAATASANLVPSALVGVAEALASGMMGFATLTLVAILVAIGLAREQGSPKHV